MRKFVIESNSDGDDSSFLPLAIITIHEDGNLTIVGRDDIGLEQLSMILHATAHEMQEYLIRLRAKAKEN